MRVYTVVEAVACQATVYHRYDFQASSAAEARRMVADGEVPESMELGIDCHDGAGSGYAVGVWAGEAGALALKRDAERDLAAEGPPPLFRNSYRCPCGQEWADEWPATCDDRCPACQTSVAPYESRDITAEADA